MNEIDTNEINLELLTIEQMDAIENINNNIMPKENNFVTDNYECAICLDSLDNLEGNKIIQLNNCNHQFHESCLKQWIDKNNTCPLCRTVVTSLFYAQINLLCVNLFKKKIIVEIKEDRIIFYSYPNKTNELFCIDYFKIKKIKYVSKYCKIYFNGINGTNINLKQKNIYFDNYTLCYNFFKLIENMILKYYKKYNLTFNYV
jgi:hypothetical protein